MAVREPVIIHWLGEMFDPALAGYWGAHDRDRRQGARPRLRFQPAICERNNSHIRTALAPCSSHLMHGLFPHHAV